MANDADEQLARQLQEQFDHEESENVYDDEEYARLLQDQLNSETGGDVALAQSLQDKFNAESVSPHIPDIPATPPYSDSPSYAPISPPPIPEVISPPAPNNSWLNKGFASEFFNTPKTPPSVECIKRVRSDLQSILMNPNKSIKVFPHENSITEVNALIIGTEGTPYQGGFFHFALNFPSNYPWAPPKVLLITTDEGRCRFNPNLYAEGKVCLSILGTWQGPGWSPVQTCLSVLVSIQSLMNERPYHNEPGCEIESKPGDALRYNECILHETIRVAVCGMLENPTCGNTFKDMMHSEFLKHYPYYLKVCQDNVHRDGQLMEDPFGENRGRFQYGNLLSRLQNLHQKLSSNTTTSE